MPKALDNGCCARCGAALPGGAFDCLQCGASSQRLPRELDVDAFHAVRMSGERPLVVHFRAQSCAPCLTLDPVFAQAALLRAGLCFASCDIDTYPSLRQDCNVRNAPTLAIYLAGRELGRISGTMRLQTLLDWIDRLIQSAASGGASKP
ncbi:thioredoxin family protein [Solimonas marina]|uniref:Thioredoxin family protein n=1 Tax=Solimonas marina TaxID=2714601 RepID=A0A969WAP2_9GAMM|nr:thioredoxin family protein [Solimonas marina]NKF23487.1 thioredoxin family protein [Solimonas marina]